MDTKERGGILQLNQYQPIFDDFGIWFEEAVEVDCN